MLLQHPWLAGLSKPAAISEDDEMGDSSPADGPAAATNGTTTTTTTTSSAAEAADPAYDEEVAQWVKTALRRKAEGLMGSSAKPALHAAPLDSVSPPAV